MISILDMIESNVILNISNWNSVDIGGGIPSGIHDGNTRGVHFCCKDNDTNSVQEHTTQFQSSFYLIKVIITN